MGDLTKNFSRREFACKCGCGFDAADIGVVKVLQHLVNEFLDKTKEAVFITISSGNRCKKRNDATPGATDGSFHLKGMAVDFKVYRRKGRELVDPDLVADILESWFPNSCGIGRYHNRVHFDTRSAPARWDARKDK